MLSPSAVLLLAGLAWALDGASAGEWETEWDVDWHVSWKWYEPIKDANVTIAPEKTSAEVEAYLEGAGEAWVPGRSHRFYHHPEKEESALPSDPSLCGVRLEAHRVWLRNGSTGGLDRLDALGRDGLVPLSFQCAHHCCGSHCCVYQTETMTFLISTLLFMGIPLALLGLALLVQFVAPSIWARIHGEPLDEEPFPRKRSIRGSFLTAASQEPPPSTMRRVKWVNEVEKDGQTVAHKPPLHRDPTDPKLNILH